MKRFMIILFMFTFLVFIPFSYAADVNLLVDDIGIAPNVRSYDSNRLNFVELSEAHKPHTKYGFGLKLDQSSLQREYITYDVDGVSAVEMTVIVNQSTFGAYHGWGMSLGVSDNPAEMPGNNINNINLGQIYPIYLSEDGIPFIKRNNQWMVYIEGEGLPQGKYSFAPSTTNISENLREFTVPIEVQDMLYPMLSIEVYKEVNPGIFEWVIQPSSNYQYISVSYLGGDKEYLETIRVSNITDALQVRVGLNYIRQTLKPSTLGDTEPDIYESFGLNYFDSIYLTQVKLELNEPYQTGYESLDEVNVVFDTKNSRRSFGYGEMIDENQLVVLIQYENGVTAELESGYTIDFMQYDSLEPNIYKIAVIYQSFRTEMNVEVLEPDELILNTQGVKTHYMGNETINLDGLVVTVRTNVGTLSVPVYVDQTLDQDQYQIDLSNVDFTQTGLYQVSVTMNDYEINSLFEITVDATNLVNQDDNNLSTMFIIIGSILGGSIILVGSLIVYMKFIKGSKRG